jgi:hypothetical protein
VRFIVKNLNVLRSTISSISTSFEVKEIVEAAVTNLPNLFKFVSLSSGKRERSSRRRLLHTFTHAEVMQNTISPFSCEEPIDPMGDLHVEKGR